MLVNLLTKSPKNFKQGLPSITLSRRSEADLEMLATGALSPLKGFMGVDDYHSVLKDMCLSNGVVWPLPIVLPTDDKTAEVLKTADEAILSDFRGKPLGTIMISDIYKAEKEMEAKSVFLTDDNAHPGVSALRALGNWYVAGEIEINKLPYHKNFSQFRKSPAELRKIFQEKGWKSVVGFQTRNPIHRAHEYLTKTINIDLTL